MNLIANLLKLISFHSNQKVTTPTQTKIDHFLQPKKKTLMETRTITEQNPNECDEANSSVENKAHLLESLNPIDKYFDECNLNDSIVDLR